VVEQSAGPSTMQQLTRCILSLKPGHFARPTDHPKVYSKFTVIAPDDVSDNLWFHVSAVDDVDWKEIAGSVIDSLEEEAEETKADE
jgi:hypothetical protein